MSNEALTVVLVVAGLLFFIFTLYKKHTTSEAIRKSVDNRLRQRAIDRKRKRLKAMTRELNKKGAMNDKLYNEYRERYADLFRELNIPPSNDKPSGKPSA